MFFTGSGTAHVRPVLQGVIFNPLLTKKPAYIKIFPQSKSK